MSTRWPASDGGGFAAKANSNLAVLRTLVRQGAGVDVVSTGEMRRALAAGCPADRIVFSGVRKTAEDLEAAHCCRHPPDQRGTLQELELLSRSRSGSGATRCGVSGSTPTSTPRPRQDLDRPQGDKFGIELEDTAAAFERARILPGVARSACRPYRQPAARPVALSRTPTAAWPS